MGLAVLLTASSCSAVGTSEQGLQSAPLPPAPPVVERGTEPAPIPDDGLFRLVVTPPSADDVAAGLQPIGYTTPEPDTTEPAAADFDSNGVNGEIEGEIIDGEPSARFLIDPDLLNYVSDDATIIFQDGVPGIIAEDGRFISLEVVAAQAESAKKTQPTPDPEDDPDSKEQDTPQKTDSWKDKPSSGDPFIDQVRQIDGVVSIVAIGNGSYAVAATSPDVLDDFELNIIPDVNLTLTADPYEPYQWTFDNTGDNLSTVLSPAPVQVVDADIDGTEAAAGPRGDGVVVAVIDTGVDFSHPDMAGQAWSNPGEICGNSADDDGNGFVDDCSGWDFGYNDNRPWMPANGNHGTHVAGIIAAVSGNGQGISGLAPGVKIMDLSVAGPGGMTTSSVARAVRYAVDNGADVINMSLGSNPGTPAQAVIPLIDAVVYAETQGVLVVVAAGNSNVNLSTSPSYPANIEADSLIVVGASTPAETKASFSNYGPVVDLFAPGDLILSTIPGDRYVFMSGTSQASPTVAAIAAAAIERDPSATPAEIKAQLIGTSDEIAAYEGQAANAVRLNAARALGVDAEGEAEADAGDYVTITGLASAQPEAVTAEISIGEPGGQFNQPHHWEASLVAIAEDGVYGLIEHPVRIDGAQGATDERGAVVLSESDGVTVKLSTALPVGSYGLVVEAIPETDSTVRLGDAFIATFDVGDPTQPPVTSPDPGSGGGDSTTSTTVNSGGSNPTAPSTPTTAPSTNQTTTPTTAPSSGGSSGGGSGSSGGGSTATTAPPSSGGGSSGGGSSSGGSGSSGGGSTATTAPPSSGGGSSGGGSTATPTPTTGGTAPTTAVSTTVPPTTAPTGGSTPTTSSGSGGGSNPTPTTTPGGTGGGNVPDPGSLPNPGTVTEGDWNITRITPSWGPTGVETMVSLSGNFPYRAFVWFGGEPGQVIFQSETWLLVMTPASVEPGTVDIQIRRNSTSVLVVPEGFTFVDGGAGPGPTTPDGNGGGSTDGGNPDGGNPDGGTGDGGPISSPTPTTVVSPDPLPTTTIVSSTTSPGNGNGGGNGGGNGNGGGGNGNSDSDDESDDDRSRNRQARASIIGEPVDLGNGLRGAPLSGLETIGGVPRCASDPCRTRRK